MTISVEQAGRQFGFPLQILDILSCLATVACDLLVARAVKTHVAAKWHVDIERERVDNAADIAARLPKLGGGPAERLDKTIRGRIRGISWSTDIVFPDQNLVDHEFGRRVNHLRDRSGC